MLIQNDESLDLKETDRKGASGQKIREADIERIFQLSLRETPEEESEGKHEAPVGENHEEPSEEKHKEHGDKQVEHEEKSGTHEEGNHEEHGAAHEGGHGSHASLRYNAIVSTVEKNTTT